MAKDGLGIIVGAVFFAIIVTIGAVLLSSMLTKIFAVLGWIFVIFSLFFFRDPERTIPAGNDHIISA